MSWGQILFSFEGRVGRKTYWMFLIVVMVVFGIIAAIAGGSAASAADPEAAAAAASKMATLMGLVPAVGGLIALVFNGFIAGTPGPNQFGPPPA